jgi:hypothetical protein
MDIVSGDRIILQLSTFEDRFLGTVADIRDGRLMASVSMPPMVRDRLLVDVKASVKYAYDGRLLGFSSRVLNIAGGESAVVELEGPGEVFDAEERSEPRCICRYSATMTEGRKIAGGMVEDMSPSCARVRYIGDGLAGFPEELDRNVVLTFHPSELDDSGYSVGCVVSKSFMKNGERYIVLRFNPDEKEMLKRISGFIEAQVCCALPSA